MPWFSVEVTEKVCLTTFVESDTAENAVAIAAKRGLVITPANLDHGWGATSTPESLDPTHFRVENTDMPNERT